MGLSEQQMDYANTLISVPNAQLVSAMRFSDVEESRKLYHQKKKNDRRIQPLTVGKLQDACFTMFLNLCLTAASAPPAIV